MAERPMAVALINQRIIALVRRIAAAGIVVFLASGPDGGALTAQPAGAPARFRTTNDRVTVQAPASLAEWQQRAAYLREHVLAVSGLLPAPEKTPLRAHVFDERRHADYTVSKV